MKRFRMRVFALILPAIALAAGCATTPAPVTVADTVAKRPELSTLSKLINDAGLADELRGPGPFTLFAPSDEAFKAVPPAKLASLAGDKQALKSVLNYHVLPAKVTSAEVTTGPAKTVNGADLAVSKAGTFVTVEDAVVTQADIAASNGEVHIVDRVLMPPAPKR